MSTTIEDLETAITEVAQLAGQAVVGIGRGWGSGSGVVVAEGLVVTNAHNLRGPEAGLVLSDGTTVAGAVAGTDLDGDLAVVRFEGDSPEPIAWEPAEVEPRIGGAVVALANPGGRGLRASLGFVASADRSFRGPRGRRIGGTFEHTAPLPRGSSGGPVVDLRGRLVGINTNRLGEGFYAALPAGAELRSRVDELAAGRTPSRRHLGIAVVPGRAARQLRRSVGLPDRDGVLVGEVDPEGPAGRAGLRRGDLVVAAGGSPLAGVDDLHAALDAVSGESLVLEVARGAEDVTVVVDWTA